MTEMEIKRSLNLVRYGGVVVTLVVFIALLAFTVLMGSVLNVTGDVFSAMLPYIIGLTVAAAVLSVVLYFAYRAYLTGRAKTTP